jgi:hypothetical protein
MKIFTKISVLAFLSSALLCGCSDWTKPEHLDFHRQTPEQADPEAYAQYLEALRAYKQSEHNVMIVGMKGTDQYPNSQSQHIMAMPDSADYVIVHMGAALHEKIAAEIPEVLQKKGTQTLLYIDYAEIAAAWQALEDERSDKGQAPGSDEELTAFFTAQAETQLSRCNPYGFAGIVVSFQGTKTAGYAYNSQTAYMTAVKAFHEANPDKVMFFRGGARNVIDQDFLKEFKYLIIVAGEEKKLSVLPGRILGSSAPKDCVIMELTVPSADVPEQVGETPVNAAAWLVDTEHSGYTPKGLCVENAHDDYFQKDMAFKNVRAAITVMNPVK